jgi:hypothetical protein
MRETDHATVWARHGRPIPSCGQHTEASTARPPPLAEPGPDARPLCPCTTDIYRTHMDAVVHRLGKRNGPRASRLVSGPPLFTPAQPPASSPDRDNRNREPKSSPEKAWPFAKMPPLQDPPDRAQPTAVAAPPPATGLLLTSAGPNRHPDSQGSRGP